MSLGTDYETLMDKKLSEEQVKQVVAMTFALMVNMTNEEKKAAKLESIEYLAEAKDTFSYNMNQLIMAMTDATV